MKKNTGKTGISSPGSAKTTRAKNAFSPDMAMSLTRYDDGDYITKAGLAEAFGCSGRTIQRMIERLEILPPATLAGRKIWIVGKLRAWITTAAERQQEEALKAMGQLWAFDS